MRAGACNPAQAQVIVNALDDLPADLDPEIRIKAEETLVAYATQFDPTQLRRLGRRILDVIAPEIAEAEEAKRLAAEEAHARKKTRLAMRRLGDGTTRISAVVPDAAADRLATNLEAFASPRRDDGTRTETGEYLPYDRRLGRALCQMLETLDPARLPDPRRGCDHGDRDDRSSTSSARKPASPRSSAAVRSPRPRPGGWPAPRTSSPPSSAVPPRFSTSAARNVSSPPPNAEPSSSGQRPARPRVATSPAPGPRPTTGSPGPKAGPPTSTTPPCSAAITTTAPTTPRTSTNAYPAATSASPDADRPTDHSDSHGTSRAHDNRPTRSNRRVCPTQGFGSECLLGCCESSPPLACDRHADSGAWFEADAPTRRCPDGVPSESVVALQFAHACKYATSGVGRRCGHSCRRGAADAGRPDAPPDGGAVAR